MADKKYYWLKFQKDFFKSLRIKKLRKLAGGDTFTIIYLKLQLLSLQTGGYLEYKGVFESFEEEMAEEIEEDAENIAVTIQYLQSCGLMEQTDNNYFLPYVPLNTGSETPSAERVRNHREKQKALHCNTDVTNCNDGVTQSKSKSIEIDKEIDSIYASFVNKFGQEFIDKCKKYPNASYEQVASWCKGKNQDFPKQEYDFDELERKKLEK